MTNIPIYKKNNSVDNRAKTALIVVIGITVCMHIIPFGGYVAYPLLLLSTLVHEMGHGVAGVLVGAHFDSFHMWSNGSGVASVTGQMGRIANGIVAAGGLVGPAITAAIFFALGKNTATARITLGAFGFATLAAEILVVRGLFGMVFVGLLTAICLGVAFKAKPYVAQIVLVLIAVQLALSVFTRADYLFTDVAQTSAGPMPSDVANMANALFLPYWFWGTVCAALSLGALALGLKLFLRKS